MDALTASVRSGSVHDVRRLIEQGIPVTAMSLEAARERGDREIAALIAERVHTGLKRLFSETEPYND
jgi:hypothetical protein